MERERIHGLFLSFTFIVSHPLKCIFMRVIPKVPSQREDEDMESHGERGSMLLFAKMQINLFLPPFVAKEWAL